MAERGEMFKFSQVDTPDKSWFDMSFDYVLSMNFGELVPTTMMEVISGDTIHAKSSVFGRLAPMVAPSYGKVNLYSYHFYVRDRDIWKSWKAFFDDAQDLEPWQNPSTFVPPVMPYIDIRKTLWNQKLFGVIHDIVVDSSTGDVELNLTDHVGYLILSKLSNGVHAEIQYNVSSATLPDPTSQFLLVPFIPNKSDVLTGRYNPFSESTLFDYLGVDISALYKKNAEDVTTFLGTVASATPGDYFDNVDGFDLFTFLNTHAILGIMAGYADSNINYWCIDALGNKYTDGNQSPTFPASYTPPVWYYDDESSKISSLALRAYHFCYIEYFRDQNYMKVNANVDFTRDGEDIDWSLSSDDIFDYLILKNKCWEHDPYTSGLPGPQRGSAIRFIPDAPVKLSDPDSSRVGVTAQGISLRYGTADASSEVFSSTTGGIITTSGSQRNLIVDLSAATIENFRFQNATQRIAEKMARGGGRYYQIMQILFGEEIPAVNLNRPVYLGGERTPIQISEVLQTSASDLSTNQPLGDMAGRAVVLGDDNYLEYHCQEHGFYIELCACIPRVSYQQGLNPMFMRKTRLDYPLSDYAQLGEEAIPVGELYYTANESKDSQVFAYQNRYYQWKYNRDRVAGSFKSSMNHWTFSRIFDSAPVAGKKFLEVKPDYRQFAVTDPRYEHIYLTMWHDIQVNRCLPVFGVPTL